MKRVIYIWILELWLKQLSYLADIFDKMNELNSSLQGTNTTTVVVVDKINANVKKLHSMVSDLEHNCISLSANIHGREQT